MENLYKEADTLQIVVQDTEEEVGDAAEAEAVTATDAEMTDLKVMKKKVTTRTIKKNLRLTKDPEDHTDADEAVVVEVVIEDVGVIADVNAVRVLAMKSLRTKDVVLKTKVENLKDVEKKKEVTDVLHEDTVADQGDHHHRAQAMRVNTVNTAAIRENKKNVVNETKKEGADVAEDVDAPKEPTVLASQEARVVKAHQRVVHLKANRICQVMKPHHSNPHKKARLKS